MATMLADDASLAAFTRRSFLKGIGAAGLLAAIPIGLGGCSGPQIDTLARILIVGGGTAGITMAARLRRACPKATITLVEPSERHYYQPGFTFIGAGVWEPDDVWMNERDLVPSGVAWLKDAVIAIDPDHNVASLRDGGKIVYDFLVLVPGIQLNWAQVKGITRETLGLGNTHSIYDFEGSVRTWKALQEFARTGGRGVFADTWTKHKCGGAPKKICLLGEHLSRKLGTRHRLSFNYFTASKQLYDVPHYTPRLEEIYRERDVPVRLNAKLTGVDVDAKKAYFEDRATGETYTETYDFLHFVPPQSAPDFVRESGLGWTEGKLADGGWVMVDPKTLVHKKYANVVSLGDVAGIPTSKTGGGVKKQAPVAVENLCAIISGKEPTAAYSGYAACPIITDYGHVIMCEFDYEKKPEPSFPFSWMDTRKELRTAWWAKRFLLKPYYFRLMLKGWV
jgi:sulfide:quinone oxidoreductase